MWVWFLCQEDPLEEEIATHFSILGGFPGDSVGKESACNAEDLSSIPRWGRSPGEGNGNTLHYSCLGNPRTEWLQFSSVQSLSRVRLFVTPWIAARQASLSIAISRSSLKLMSIELVMPSSHLILCRPPFLLPPVPPSITVFSNELTLCMRWPKYCSFSLSIIPSKECPGLISFRMDF